MSDTAKSRWYLNRDGEQHGPFDVQRLLTMLAKEDLEESDYVWNECLSGWMQVKDVPQLRCSSGIKKVTPPSVADKQETAHGSFRVRCRCGNLLGLSPDAVGHNVLCPKCGESLFVEIRAVPSVPHLSRDDSARTPKRVAMVEVASSETLLPRDRSRSAHPTVKQERSPAASVNRPSSYPKPLTVLRSFWPKPMLANGLGRSATTAASRTWLSVAASRWPLIVLGIWLSLSALLYALYRAHRGLESESLLRIQAARYEMERSFADLSRRGSPINIMAAQSATAGFGSAIREYPWKGEATRNHRQRQLIVAVLALLSALACWRSFGVSRDSINIRKLIARNRT